MNCDWLQVNLQENARKWKKKGVFLAISCEWVQFCKVGDCKIASLNFEI